MYRTHAFSTANSVDDATSSTDIPHPANRSSTMKTTMVLITLLLLVTWGAAFIERSDSFMSGKREPSLWSLLLVALILALHIVLVYAEGVLL